MIKLIALTGAAGSGKSTVAKHLSNQQIPFARTKFSGTLKKMLMQIPNVTIDMTEGELKEEPQELFGGKTPREVMQTLGTEWGRDSVYSKIWLDSWERSICDLTYIVVEDLRYLNEAELVKRRGGQIWRIKRPDYKCNGHISETEMEGIDPDLTIRNNGSVEELHAMIDSILIPWSGEDIEPGYVRKNSNRK
tara:strand:- start:1138 stop:1713 length:576 start_codon:yes stop_codon:yes gene_type:complete